MTLPYTEEQWSAIAKAGHEVDRRLQAGDVRLSMGGEPTFVSIDDVDGAEWNTDAVGPTKRRYAENLIRRLRDRFAPGGLLHYGQGKWYPGEQLPRWAFAVYWRADGQPLWENAAAHRQRNSGAARRPSTTPAAFAATLAEQLGLPADSALPAYEDPAHFLLIEQKLPINLDPATNKLDDPQERARVIKVFERGLDKPSGYVMPIQVWHSQARGRSWVTERWALPARASVPPARRFARSVSGCRWVRFPISGLRISRMSCPIDPFAAHARLAAARGAAARPARSR